MTPPRTVAVLVGSLRKDSYNQKLALALAHLAPPELTFEHLRIDDLPAYNQDDDGNQAASVKRLKTEIAAAQGLLFVTPEYNRSIPGVLKNAIDCASRPYGDSAWTGKPVAVMGASVGTLGTARAQYHLRQTFVFLNMYPVNQPEVMVSNAQKRFDQEGKLTDDTTKQLVRQLLSELVNWTKRLSNDAR